jgi:hypothetical protein
MKKLIPYKRIFKEKQDINELIGYLKSKYKSLSQAKNDNKFKSLISSDKEYVTDELKSDGYK